MSKTIQQGDAEIVVPDETNGYETMIPEYLIDRIAAYQAENPDAEQACWAEVCAYCMAGAGHAPRATDPLFATVYTYAVDQLEGMPEISDTLNLLDGMVPEEQVEQKAAELREEIANAR